MIIFVVILSFVSKFLGFTRELVLSNYYGASSISDIYLVSTTIPIVLWAIIGLGFVTVYMPVVTKFDLNDNIKINQFSSKFLNVILFFVTIFILVFHFYSEQIISLIAIGFSSEDIKISIGLTKLMIFSLYFTGIVSVLSAYLQLKGRFKFVAAISFPLNIILITSIILAYNYSLDFFAYGFILASFSQVLFLFPFAYKSGFRYFLLSPFKDRNIKHAVNLSIPVVFSVLFIQINILVDKNISSSFGEGSVSYLNYAFIITSVVHTIIVMSLVSVAYPSITKFIVSNNIIQLSQLIINLMKLTIFALLPVSIFFIFYSVEIIDLIYKRGMFDDVAVENTSLIFYFYSFGILGVGFREILFRIFYGFSNTKTPVLISITCVLINIFLSIYLSRIFGVPGVALGTSISAFLTCFLSFLIVIRLYGNIFDVIFLFVFTLKSLFLSLSCMFISFFTVKYVCVFFNFEDYYFFVCLFLNFVLYITLSLLLKIITLSDFKFKVTDF